MNLRQENLSGAFIELAKTIPNPVVFELGTKQSIPMRSTMHKDWVPHASKYLGIDIEAGMDVDYIADAHTLVNDLREASDPMCDIFISCSTFEHIRNPFRAMNQIGQVIKSGGLLFVQTHHTFPLHAYPYDFWRYTIESLSCITIEARIDIVDCAYQFPCQIISEQDPNTRNHPSFLNVCLIGRKP